MAKSVLNRNKKAKKRFGNYVNRAFQLKKKQKGLSSHPDKKRGSYNVQLPRFFIPFPSS